MTRTIRNNSFKKGILPLDEAFELLFNEIYLLINDKISLREWKEIKNNIVNINKRDDTKNFKTCQWNISNRLRLKDFGPFAVLIKDIAFYRDTGNHDYLSRPEIIEDIGNYLLEIHNLDIISPFQEKAAPCIVKFIDYSTKEHYLEVAFIYLYYMYHKKQITFCQSTNFDSYRKRIEPENIIYVEFIK